MIPLKNKKTFLIIFMGVALIAGCGVKGDPLPPKQAPRLGRGHPTYTKASQQVTPEYENEEEDSINKKGKDK